MILFNKKVGETPLQMLDRFRLERPEFSESKLSYIGRLDPMAEGDIIILIDEENKEYEKHLGYDKEYEATFLVGCSTDTGDVLGLIEPENKDIFSKVRLEENINKLKEIKIQKYPWFSAMTVDGKKLFDHYKEGNLDIDRPERDVEIKDVQLINLQNIKVDEIKKYIFDSINSVQGDFRQKQILDKWEKYLLDKKMMQTFTVKIHVSSGTYIRGLTENFDIPVTLMKLKRTKIFI